MLVLNMERAVISITDSCNLKCLHCYKGDIRTYSRANYINTSFITTLKKLGVKQIVVSGGEPTIDWVYLLDIIDILNSGDFSIILTTNGLLLSQDRVNQLKKKKVQRIQVSIDGPNKEIHELLRGVGTFAKPMELLINNPSFIMPMYTIHGQNYNFVRDFLDIAISLGIESVGFERYIPINNRLAALELSKEQLFDAYSIITKYNNKVHIHINDPLYNVYLFLIKSIPAPNYLNNISCGCQALTNNIYIESDGNVYSCIFSKDIISNIANPDVFEKLVNIQFLLKNECEGCDFFCICKGCRAASYCLTGDWNKKDPLCPIY